LLRWQRIMGGGEMQFIDPKGSFLKNLVLSLLLIGLTSLLIPLVLKQIDDRKAVDQQRFQDQLSRQDTILDAQAALLDTMATDFWDYEFFASDVVISRDERFGQDAWHARAVDNYYTQTGPLLGKIRADISTLLRLAPQATYDSFLRLYEDEMLPLDSCLLELMKLEQAATDEGSQPAHCTGSEGKFAGASWDTLADTIVRQDLAESIDREFASLAVAFRLQGTPD
jgi:hypothetical protein